MIRVNEFRLWQAGSRRQLCHPKRAAPPGLDDPPQVKCIRNPRIELERRVRLAKRLSRQPKSQWPWTDELHPVVIDRNIDGPSIDCVIPVADRVDQCFPQRLSWIKRIVLPLEHIRQDAAGNRQMIDPELLRLSIDLEGIASDLASESP